ncbi:MAG: hypothetical protein WAV66_20350 [Anaerolineae bacterium]
MKIQIRGYRLAERIRTVILVFGSVCITLLAGMVSCTIQSSPAHTPTSSPHLTLDALKNAEYRTNNLVETIRLTDGFFYPPPISGESQSDWFVMLTEPVIFGDVSGDDVPDAVLILTSRFGGTGIFRELAVVVNDNGKPHNTATDYLGDRVIINTAKIQDGEIILDMVVHGPNDGFCCPSLETTWIFTLAENGLTKTSRP